MGQRGPQPEPTRLKLIKGETRPSRVNYAEPIPARANIDAPDDLDDESRAAWEQVMGAIGHTGIITAADTEMLRLYVEAVTRYRMAERALRKSGPLLPGRNGDLVKNPLHQVVRDNAVLMQKLARELGLTPSARTGMRGNDDDANRSAQDKLDSLLAAARKAR